MEQSSPKTDLKNNRHLLIQYGGLAIQWVAVLLVAILGGRKIDQWMKLKKPVFAWVLPVLGLVGLLYKVIKDTGNIKKK